MPMIAVQGRVSIHYAVQLLLSRIEIRLLRGLAEAIGVNSCWLHVPASMRRHE